jgi:arabinogalactan endo-1,4-beta-galactosidase
MWSMSMTRSFGASLMACAALLGVAGQAWAAQPPSYVGVDISYANEMDDCGAVYRSGGQTVEQYAFFKSAGANIARIRIWNDPDWTAYSNLKDVKRSIARARKAGLQVLLDFHYSDDWADGDKQLVPKAWAQLSTADQAKALYAFTRDTLTELDREGLAPDLVQVGNETNGEIMSTLAKAKDPINWDRNALLFNAGIKAVRDFGAGSKIKPRIMLHIAQPENVEPWFASAEKAGITDFDLIGISYYSKWSKRSMAQLGETINRMRHLYKADVLVVETAYPFSPRGVDASPDLLGPDSLIAGYPATPAGQKKYLIDLTQLVFASGGVGVVYWEPSWVSTKCKTRWGTGSNWENAALFDFKGQPLEGVDWLKTTYVHPVDVEFRAPAASEAQRFIDGDFLGGVGPRAMTREGDVWTYRTRLMPGAKITAGTASSAQAVADAPALTAVVGKGATVIPLKLQP